MHIQCKVAVALVTRMVDVTIGRLGFRILNAAGHEHRVQGIAQRTAYILGERLGDRLQIADGGARTVHIDTLSAPTLDLDLNQFSDAEVAARIANAWLDAQTPHSKV